MPVYEAPVRLNEIPAALALLSVVLALWQWLVARRFPLHRRIAEAGNPQRPAPGVTLLKPLKGCEPETEACLRSWLAQQYGGPVQALFGVASSADPVCAVVGRLLEEFPNAGAQLVVCDSIGGANAKVCTLAALEERAAHDIVVVSDADVRVPPDLLANVVTRLQTPGTGLVNCFYRLANPTTVAMRWEAVAVNADFWSQVLQSQSLRPLDFALGAVMATRRRELGEIGGFRALLDCLADDYQLGHRIALRGHRIALSTVVVECWSAPLGWAEVWRHQLRWARTIRVCQPVPYFFSILSNATLWPLLWVACRPVGWVCGCMLGCLLVRMSTALHLQRQLAAERADATAGRVRVAWHDGWLAWLKDLLQAAIWVLAFTGSRVEWRGERMRLRRDGTLVRNGR
jgi:ceramide glucosyltransferase